MRYLITFFFITVQLFGFDYHLKPYPITKGVHCFFGLPSTISPLNGANIVNSCYIETSEGYVVIDSGPTYLYAQSSYSIMEKIKKLPVKYVINTSSEEVHVLGNDFYKEQGATIIGSENYKRHFLKAKEPSLSTQVSEDAFHNTRLIPLDIYLKQDKSLTLGNLQLDIKVINEDNEHLVVFLPKKKILFSGDMIFNNRLLSFNNKRSLQTWRRALQELRRLDWKDTVSSHGLMTRRSAFKNTESYLALLEHEVKESLSRKETKEEAINSILLSSFSEDRLYSFWHPKNVASVYDEFAVDINLTSEMILPLEHTPIINKEKRIKIEKKEKQIIKLKPKKSKALHYLSFKTALRRAKKNNKIVFLKVRSTTCKYCDQLDRVIAKNSKVKRLLKRYFELVQVNSDYDKIPLDVTIRSTPTIVFIRPKDKKVLMSLPGIHGLREFLEILNEAIDDGHNGGYLKR